MNVTSKYLTILSMLTVATGASILYNDAKTGDQIILDADTNQTQEVQDMLDVVLNPGNSFSYRIELNVDRKFEAEINVWFGDEDNSDALKYIHSYVVYGEESTESKSLDSYNEDTPMSFTSIFDEKNNYFDLVFELPVETSNEAQNLDLHFNTYFSVSGEAV